MQGGAGPRLIGFFDKGDRFIKLYGFILSPFTQRVVIAVRLKGHELMVEPPPGGRIQTAEFAAISPMRRVPVLEADDGWRIAESTAIIDYLDDVLEGPPLLPSDPKARALARQTASFVDAELAPGLRHFMAQCVFRSRKDAGQLAYGREQVALAFDALCKAGLGNYQWAAAGVAGIADAALIPQLALAEILQESFDVGDLFGKRPGLKTYWERVKQIELGARTLREMSAIVPIIMDRRSQAGMRG